MTEGTDLTDLWVFQKAEELGGAVWRVVERWQPFSKWTVSEQLVRAADSVGANIAEAFGRFHYGDKLHFPYYAKGSLYETRFWLRQAYKRRLIKTAEVDGLIELIPSLAVAINNFASSLKNQRKQTVTKESEGAYVVSQQSPQISQSPSVSQRQFSRRRNYHGSPT
ncbi:MAG: four helix bundle protein [Chloroflexi bacterium]|nr:MAG: four helix bundle protein [Chloroflexota bacterium]